MIDVVIIDNKNIIAHFINEKIAKVTVYGDGICALNAIEISKPEIIFVNYNINETALLEFISLLFKVSKQSPIVMVGPKLSDQEILDCLASGAKGYLQASDLEQFINKLIKAVSDGEAWISRRLVSMLLDRLHQQNLTET